MIKNAIKGHKFFSVSTFENTSENISFTIDTVYYFKKKFKSRSLRIIMGEDNFYSFTSWYKYADILSSVNIIVLSRDNIERYDKINGKKKISICLTKPNLEKYIFQLRINPIYQLLH